MAEFVIPKIPKGEDILPHSKRKKPKRNRFLPFILDQDFFITKPKGIKKAVPRKGVRRKLKFDMEEEDEDDDDDEDLDRVLEETFGDDFLGAAGVDPDDINIEDLDIDLDEDDDD